MPGMFDELPQKLVAAEFFSSSINGDSSQDTTAVLVIKLVITVTEATRTSQICIFNRLKQ